MLNPTELENQLSEAFHELIPNAAKQAFISTQGNKSKEGEEMANRFAETLDDMLSDELAKALATSIDYYLKSATLTGTLLAVGAPISPVYTVNLMPLNLGNPAAGVTPNTLKIS